MTPKQHVGPYEVRDDPKVSGDSEEIPISEWSGWQFDSRSEIFYVVAYFAVGGLLASYLLS